MATRRPCGRTKRPMDGRGARRGQGRGKGMGRGRGQGRGRGRK